MKKIHFLVFVICCLFSFCPVFAQEDDIYFNKSDRKSKNEISSHIVNKEINTSYDSLSNLDGIDSFSSNIFRMAGQTLYLADDKNVHLVPQTKMGFSKISSNEKHLGQSFIVEIGRDKYVNNPILLLKDAKKGKTYSTRLIGSVDKSWVVMGFYEKMKQMFLNRRLIVHNTNEILYSVKTGEQYRPTLNSIWLCVDVGINTDIDDYRASDRTRVILVVENEKDERYFCFLKSKMKHSETALLGGIFFTEENSERVKKIETEQLAEQLAQKEKDRLLFIEKQKQDSLERIEENARQEKARVAAEKQRKEAAAKRRTQLESKYKKSDVDLMLKHRVLLGWTKQMCIEALGKPERINKTTSIYGNSEQWVYSGGYLYFENGLLTTVQN